MNLAFTATQIARTLATDDILFLADDEQQAETLAAAVRCLRPDNPVLHVASSDALPGDSAPASPANAGKRVAALYALRLTQQNKEWRPVACILSGGGSARQRCA